MSFANWLEKRGVILCCYELDGLKVYLPTDDERVRQAAAWYNGKIKISKPIEVIANFNPVEYEKRQNEFFDERQIKEYACLPFPIQFMYQYLHQEDVQDIIIAQHPTKYRMIGKYWVIHFGYKTDRFILQLDLLSNKIYTYGSYKAVLHILEDLYAINLPFAPLHAMSAQRGAEVIIVWGKAGSGKSTFASDLIEKGYQVWSEEFLGVRDKKFCVEYQPIDQIHQKEFEISVFSQQVRYYNILRGTSIPDKLGTMLGHSPVVPRNSMWCLLLMDMSIAQSIHFIEQYFKLAEIFWEQRLNTCEFIIS